jgi:thiol-disulfide isomerase/thioredoxin
MKKRAGILFLGFSATLAALAGIWFGLQSEESADKVGANFLKLQFEPVSANGIDASKTGQTSQSSQSAAKTESIGAGKALTVVNFWATWCAPCIEELPAVSTLAAKYPNVRFVGIGVDSESKVRGFIQTTPLSFPVSASGAVAVEWSKNLGNEKGGLPFTVLIDSKGSILQRIGGTIDLVDLEKRLNQVRN